MFSFKTGIKSAILSAAVGLALSSTALAESVKVTFVLTNDTYEMDADHGRGGFPKLAAAVKQERANNPNTIFVHAGDLLSPSLFSGFDQGEHMIVLSNMVGIDLFTPGNHEYDFGPEVAAKRMQESDFPWLAANVTQADGSPVEGMEGTMIKEIGGVKIGFIGLAEETSAELSSPGDLKFQPAYDAAEKSAKELKDAGAEFIVAINHNERDIAQKMIDDGVVDLDLNGHNHDLWLFYNGKSAAVESGSDAHYVTSVDINFDIEEKDGKRDIKWSPDFRITDTASLTPDEEVQAKVDSYNKELDTELGVAVGKTAIELDSRRASVRSMETALGDIIADAMKKAVGADIAITNGGGIRGDTTYAAGTELTRKDILSELPFGNKTVMIELTGAKVKEALENGVSQVEKTAGRFPQVSGVSFSYDETKPAGERVSDVMVDGKPIDDGATYKVATNDYMAGGGDGYSVFAGAKMLVNPESAKLMANDVMAYIKGMGEISSVDGNRITKK